MLSRRAVIGCEVFIFMPKMYKFWDLMVGRRKLLRSAKPQPALAKNEFSWKERIKREGPWFHVD